MAYQPPTPYQPGGHGPGPDRRLFVEGLRKVESALLVSIIATLLAAGALIAGIGAIFGSIGMGGENVTEEQVMQGLMAGAVAASVLLLLSVILSIASLVYLYRGMSLLGQADPKLGVGSTGVKISLAGAAIMLLGALILVPAVAAGSLALALTAGSVVFFALILILVGGVMLLIAFWRLGDMEDGSLIHAGVALIILGALLSMAKIGGILSFVGTILLYLGVKNLRAKMESELAQPPGTAPPVQPGAPPPSF